MVSAALLNSVDALDAGELDELIEYATERRLGEIQLTGEQRALLDARAGDTNPANWLTDEEFDARLDALTD
jgi:hypothetical protein